MNKQEKQIIVDKINEYYWKYISAVVNGFKGEEARCSDLLIAYRDVASSLKVKTEEEFFFLDADEIRCICVENNYFTCGDIEKYNYVLTNGNDFRYIAQYPENMTQYIIWLTLYINKYSSVGNIGEIYNKVREAVEQKNAYIEEE